MTRFGTIRLRIARTRDKNFLPVGLQAFQRRADEVSLLKREAFLRGISTRGSGRSEFADAAGRQSETSAHAGGLRVKADGRRELLGFLRSQGESQHDWEGLLRDLYQRGLEGRKLQMIITDGCAGLAAAIRTIYPRALHQRCWVHKMRNTLEKVSRARL